LRKGYAASIYTPFDLSSKANVRRVFEIVRFTEMIPIVASVHDAMELLRTKRS